MSELKKNNTFEVSLKEIDKARAELLNLEQLIEHLERLEAFNQKKKLLQINASDEQLEALKKLRIISQPSNRKKRFKTSQKRDNQAIEWLSKRVSSVAASSATGLLVAVATPTVIAWPALAALIAFLGSEYFLSKDSPEKPMD